MSVSSEAHGSDSGRERRDPTVSQSSALFPPRRAETSPVLGGARELHRGHSASDCGAVLVWWQVFKLLDRFEMSIMNCLGYDRDLDMVLA